MKTEEYITILLQLREVKDWEFKNRINENDAITDEAYAELQSMWECVVDEMLDEGWKQALIDEKLNEEGK